MLLSEKVGGVVRLRRIVWMRIWLDGSLLLNIHGPGRCDGSAVNVSVDVGGGSSRVGGSVGMSSRAVGRCVAAVDPRPSLPV